MFVNDDASVFAFFADVCLNGYPFETLIPETRQQMTIGDLGQLGTDHRIILGQHSPVASNDLGLGKERTGLCGLIDAGVARCLK